MNRASLILLTLLLSVNVWGEDDVVATFESSSVVTNSTYQSYSNDDWSLSIGGNNNSCGFNKNNKTQIGNAYGTIATTTHHGYTIVSKNKLDNVYKMTFVFTGKSANGTPKLYLGYSTDGSNWSAVELKEGTGLSKQGDEVSTINTTYTFEFKTAISSAYYAIIHSASQQLTTSSHLFRFDGVTATFYASAAPAEPFSVTLKRFGQDDEVIDNLTSDYTLPAVADEDPACDGWEFIGWSTDPVSSTTTAPEFVTKATATGTYYAVYGKTEGGAVVTFTPGTTTSGYFTISSGENYASGTGSKINAVAASNADSYLFTQISDNQYSIKLGDNYITYSSSTNLGTSTTPYSWTISKGTNGDWRVASGTSGRALIYRAGSTNQFGGYSSSNATATSTEYYDVTIGGGGTTTYNSNPSCATLYAISTISPANGSIQFSTDLDNWSTTIADQPEGADVYFKLIPASGYEISGTPSLSTGGDITDMGNGIYGFDMPASAVTVFATFAAKQTLNITANAPDGGTYTVKIDAQTPVTITSAQTLHAYEGAVITMTSTADEMHKLHSTPFVVKNADNEDIKLSKSGDNYSFTMPNKAVTVTAQYTATYSITAASCTGGSITKITDKDGNDITRTSLGSKVIVNLSANNHYHIKSVYFIKEGEESHNEITENAGVYSFNMVASNVTVYAEFEEDTKYTITFVDAVHGESVAPKSVYENETFTFPSITDKTAVAPTGDCMADHYHFIGWVEEGTTPTQSPSNVITAGATSVKITENVTYKAVWAKEEL